MSGISTGTGFVSGLDYTSLINQLLQLEGRPKTLAQQRIVSLQSDQAAFFDLNSRLGALKAASTKFRTQNIFNGATAASSDDTVLSASASAGAALGGYSFIVDRIVGTQQVLTRGFADRNSSAVGASSITVEDARGRLDSDTSLGALNGGQGVARGKVVITDNSGASATIDLSRVATVGELLEKINSTTAIRINARADGDKLVIEDETGVAGTLRVENAIGYTTATSLGIEGSSLNAPIEGAALYFIGDSTSLSSLNDGSGIRFNTAAGAAATGQPAASGTPDFTIKTHDGSTYAIDIGDIWESVDGELTKTASNVSDIASLRQRIEDHTEGKVTLEVSSDGRALRVVDSSTGASNLEVIDIKGAAADLKLVGSTASASIDGAAVLAGLNSTLASNLGGGTGIASGDFTITARDGSQFNFAVATDGSIADILNDISELTGGAITASIGPSGVGIRLTDNTGGVDNFVVEGAGAEALGLSTGATGVAGPSVSGTRLQHRYIAESTLLSSLNDGRGLGTGTFTIVGPGGQRADVIVGADARSIGDVIEEINSRGIGVQARINDNGDGLVIEKAPGATGATKIEVSDKSGAVGKGLNIVGTAANATDENFIDGSFETVIELEASDTLDDLVAKFNEVKPGVAASVIRDGSGSSPFRLKFSSTQSGVAGAFTIEAAGIDLALTEISEARNARIFYGSDDPAAAVLLESSSNVFDGVIDGLTINARAVSDDPITLTVDRDTAAIETAVTDFVAAFNDIASRIGRYTAYDAETQSKGALLGDSTANELRRGLYDQLLRPARGISGAYRFLSQVGIKVGSGGSLEVNSEKLRAAIADDPESVAELFSARTQDARDDFVDVSEGIRVNNTSGATFSSLGVAEQFAQFVDRYTDSVNGLLKRRTGALDTEIAAQNSRISDVDARLARRRDYYTRQFASLEQTIASLQSQQSALSSLG